MPFVKIYNIIFASIITLGVVAQVGAQENHVILAGVKQHVQIDAHIANSYTWEVFLDNNGINPAPQNTFSFENGINNSNEAGITFNAPGEFYLIVSETNLQGCTTRRAVGFKVVNIPSIAFEPATNGYYCSGENAGLTLKFNGYPPWHVTIANDETNENVFDADINIEDVIDLGDGYYSYNIILNGPGYVTNGDNDIVHTFTITGFDDRNTSETAGIEGLIEAGKETRKITFYKLPEISTINHN